MIFTAMTSVFLAEIVGMMKTAWSTGTEKS